MANIKITELDAATTLASTDVVPVVDVSEDVTKKITTTNLFRTLPDGTAAAPALAFADDNNTGILSPAENQLAFATGGTQRVTIDGSGNVTISGDLTVSGATTTVESTTVTIDDKNIELGSVASPSNTTADGGGITLKGATDKEIKWVNSTGYWTFNTGIEVGGHLQIDDSNEIRVGTGQDLKIYHDGTNSRIGNSTGALIISNGEDDQDIVLQTDNGSGGVTGYVRCDGSIGSVRLYHYGTEKASTKSDGFDVIGELQCDSLDVDGAVNIDGSSVTYDSSNGLKLADSVELRFGGGNDLRLYHNATNSYIANYTGNVYILTAANDKDIYLQSDDGSGGTATYVQCDGSNGEVRLFHYGTEKLNTKSDGIDVAGEVQCDSLDVNGTVDITGNVNLHANLDLQDDDRLRIGSSDDLQLRHNGTDSHIQNDTGTLFLTNYANDKDITLRSDDGSGDITNYIVCDGSDGKVRVYHYGTQKFETTSTGINVTGEAKSNSLFVNASSGLGNTAGDSQDLAEFKIANSNSSKLRIVEQRDTNGTEWTTAYTRIQKTIDSTDQGYIQFNGSDTNYGIEFGTQSDERFARFIQNGAVALYYDNVLKFQTKSDGIDVTGEVQCDSLDVDGVADITGNVTLHANLDLQDNDRIRCGTSDDLQIYHDATNSVITNSTGDLHIRGDGDDIYLRAADDVFIQTQNGETAAKFIGDGAVELNYDDIKKFATKSDGVDITGELQCDSLDVDGGADITGNVVLHADLDLQDDDFILMGAGDDFKLHHNGSNSHIQNYTGGFYIDQHADDNDIQLRTDNGSGSITTYVLCDGSTGSTKLFHYGSEKLATQTYGIDVQGEVQCDSLDVDGIANIGASDTSDARIEIGAGATGNRNSYVDLIGDTTYTDYGLRVQRDNGGANGASKILHRGTGDFRFVAQEAAAMEFFTSNLERLRIDPSGRLMLNTTTEGEAGADNLTIADSGACGITIRSGTSSNGNIFFSDATSGSAEYDGFVQYQHSNRAIRFGSAATERLRFTSTGAWAIGGASNYGTSGQVLTSNGNSSPTWQDITVSAGSQIVNGTSNVSVAQDGDINLTSAGTLRMQIDSTGAKMPDNQKLRLGSSSDLQIYHDGTDGFIENYTEALVLRNHANDRDIYLQTDNGSGGTTNYIKCDGSTGDVVLYQYGNQKLQTFSSGVDITGELQCDSLDCDGSADFTGDATFRGGAAAVNVVAGSDIRFASGTWTGNSCKIQHHVNYLYIQGGTAGIRFRDNGGSDRARFDSNGHFLPEANNTYDLGSSSYRWRNVYTNDLNLSNEGSTNDVDGTWGNYTIQEGEDDLFLINRRNGKKYKFNLTEVS